MGLQRVRQGIEASTGRNLPTGQDPDHRAGKSGANQQIRAIHHLVRSDFDEVNRLIPTLLTSDVDLVEEIGRYIVDSGGKRLRPLMVLLGARCFGYEQTLHIRLAAVIEFLHTATLLHDDVVDHSGLRRGRATANALWGNAPSVLVGDFLYSRAFQLMVEIDSMDILSILSDATNTIAQGEVMQLSNIGNTDLTEAEYMEIIRCKTALLFQAATHTAAVLATDDPDSIAAMRSFGLHFGLAYQLVDDWMDYAGDSALMGKNTGDDLAEGKLTLPLIYTLAHGSSSEGLLLRNALQAKSVDQLDDVLCIVRESGAMDYTRDKAADHGERALNALTALPDNRFRQALSDLTRNAVARLH